MIIKWHNMRKKQTARLKRAACFLGLSSRIMPKPLFPLLVQRGQARLRFVHARGNSFAVLGSSHGRISVHADAVAVGISHQQHGGRVARIRCLFIPGNGLGLIADFLKVII